LGKYLSLLKNRLSAAHIRQGTTAFTAFTAKTTENGELSGEFLSIKFSKDSEDSEGSGTLSYMSEEKHAHNFTEYETLFQDIKLKNDRDFVNRRFNQLGIYGNRKLTVLRQYLNEWALGSASESSKIKRENTGRFRANQWLLNKRI